MRHDAIRSGKRRPVNLSIDTGVVEAARAAEINLSQVSEVAIRAATREASNRRWADEHRERIDAFAGWLDDNGMPFEDLRVF